MGKEKRAAEKLKWWGQQWWKATTYSRKCCKAKRMQRILAAPKLPLLLDGKAKVLVGLMWQSESCLHIWVATARGAGAALGEGTVTSPAAASGKGDRILCRLNTCTFHFQKQPAACRTWYSKDWALKTTFVSLCAAYRLLLAAVQMLSEWKSLGRGGKMFRL